MPNQVVTEPDVSRITERGRFSIDGLALLEGIDTMPEELQLTAYAFDSAGRLLGSAPLHGNGRFSVPVELAHQADIQLLVGPAGEPETILKSAVYKQRLAAADWTLDEGTYRVKPRVFVPDSLWKLWRPVTIFVSGHIRNLQGNPIPYTKVEIFDVDREPFLWRYLVQRHDFLASRRAIRMSDLIQDVRQLRPERIIAGAVSSLGPQPEPPDLLPIRAIEPIEAVSLNPQPEPPVTAAALRVGEMAAAEPALRTSLEGLTITSIEAPWERFPIFFFSKALVATDYTHPDGLFHVSFQWHRFHLRRGRMRFDNLPDIIVRVTQVIDGIENVVYMDPYSSTRWNVSSTHIDLYLDYPGITAGATVVKMQPAGLQTFFSRIGNDEVFKIDQTSGKASGTYTLPGGPAANCSNLAYGGELHVHGQLGTGLTTGLPKRYYRLSYRKGAAGDFTPITAPLSDVRVDKSTMANGGSAETFNLGPHTLNPGTPNEISGLYEVRDNAKYYWYNPDWLSLWQTNLVTDGTYTLNLEVFDENGHPLANVDYRDGTVKPVPATGLPKVSRCNLTVAVQNQRPKVDLVVGGVSPSGIIPWAANLMLNLQLNVTQPGGLLASSGLFCVKGLSGAAHELVHQSFPAGSAGGTTNLTVPVNNLGITESYAVAFKLWAWAHIRNGYDFLYYNEEINAIAIVKCPLTPTP